MGPSLLQTIPSPPACHLKRSDYSFTESGPGEIAPCPETSQPHLWFQLHQPQHPNQPLNLPRLRHPL
ncbi:hypothetical protein ACN38_g1966 [Penicillium nordicum]|uniref:Uncharacterized protein n=1 Tax=Penicillium nordicum TaxID=229535 RepID=A0A0M9WJD2_9EURO|nr:hypothetical protein ACN38_g1966 [Penicillium nordicum]